MRQVWHKITDCVNQSDLLAAAADRIRQGGLVVFPTETVYGLGADALNPLAVKKIFALKERPATNPLILHVAHVEQARRLTTFWPPEANALAAAFWPGPLTLVLPKAAIVPPEATAGGPTVAIRIPAHPVALVLLRLAKVPLAAPSANRSGEVSPTRAEHVFRSLSDRFEEIDLVLDAGPTTVGLESTVLSLVNEPTLLRPGMITSDMIENVLGRKIRIGNHLPLGHGALPSPGLLQRHYSPRTRMELRQPGAAQELAERVARGERLAWVTQADECPEGVVIRRLPKDPERYAASLYEVLHELDAMGIDRIVVDAPPSGPAWLAIHDRLRRAAAQD
jgi:L-threonylcarbamoyladenylate synthase